MNASVLSDRAFDVSVTGMTKRFGDFVALDKVDAHIPAGTFHALLGENGAGKSTLVKCMMGFYHKDEGAIRIDGKEHRIDGPREAHDLGLGMVYQHFTLVPSMTVLENLVMNRPHIPQVINWEIERKRLQAFMETVPFKVPLDKKTSELSAGEKQKTEILKQLYLDCRFLILDEPTSVLTPQEADEILGLIRGMAQENQLTVLMITHKFREVRAFADAVTILRRGKLVGSGAVSDLSVDEMATMMIGSEEIRELGSRAALAGGETRLELRDVNIRDDSGADAIKGVNLQIRSGEIVGIAGVSGNGQIELVEGLAGQRPIAEGEVLVHGKPFGCTRAEIRDHKLACLPEEPLKNACVGNMSVADNLAFRSFDIPPFCGGNAWLNRKAFSAQAEERIGRYGVKARSPAMRMSELSGGNVQRAVLARELGDPADVLITANPVFGLDFSAVADIHAQIMEARNNGAAVLLVSEDLDELLELSDRLIVISGGQFVHETRREDADLGVIGLKMAGH
ncbi:MAG: ABC transporter ATP-binding protein [Rhodospirillales bacterium]|nr:ABC transporter ATP-binding protein [Rhodospirillales bacterium]